MLRNERTSIATRLTGINILVSAIALLLASLAFGVYDRATFRDMVVRNLSIEAQIAGSNCISALLFNDVRTAEETLSALNAAPNIVSAEIYTPDAQLFARYLRDGHGTPGLPPTVPAGMNEIHEFTSDELMLARPIRFQGKTVGTVIIRSGMGELNTRRTQYIRMLVIVLIGSLIAAGLLSWISQRAISQPIVHLAEITKRVSGERDYSVRATDTNHVREITDLTRAFNAMLTEIQQRDEALEERVRQRTAELASVNKELEAFSYSVSHDLRAPLRHVTGFVGLLEGHAHDTLDEQSRKYLNTISRAAKRMGQLIDDLLAFSRMGRGQLVKRRVSLNDLARDARQEVTVGQTEHREIEWDVHELPEVQGDQAMLRLVMINLLSNAVKYSSLQPKAHIEVGTSPNGAGETVVFVRDNGVGFDMQYVDKLFGVFQRLHSSDEFEGTGIGLANVKRIVHRHGGRVWAEGQIDVGSTFYFSIPSWKPET